MTVSYKINGVYTTKSLTEWFIGKGTVKRLTDAAKKHFHKTGEPQNRVWCDGTGWLTIIVEEAAK